MYAYLCQAIGLSTAQIEESPDLSLGETVSHDPEAVKHYVLAMTGLGNYMNEMEKAIALDSTFTYAYFSYANYLTTYNRGQLEAKFAIDKAMKYRKRLHYDFQIQIMVLKHLIYQEWDKAEKLLKIQLEIDPNNEGYNYALSDVYFKTGQIEKLVKHAENRFAQDPTPGTGFQAMKALLMNGEPEKVISQVKAYLLLDKQNLAALQLLAMAYLHNEEFDEAKNTLEKIILIKPEAENNITHLFKAINYIEQNDNEKTFLKKFEGKFRLNFNEQVFSQTIIGDFIYFKGQNQQGHFMYPDSDTSLVYATTGWYWKSSLIIDNKKTVKGTKFTNKNDGQSLGWKQDTVIRNAESLLKEGDYPAARIAYQEAIDQNPEHFYLSQAKEHLEYLQSKPDSLVQQSFQKLVGQYGTIKIWVEDGLLYYKRPGVTRRILRPLSDNRFTALLNYQWNYEFVEKDGKIVGIQGHQYNHETKEWGAFDNWYYERTKLLD